MSLSGTKPLLPKELDPLSLSALDNDQNDDMNQKHLEEAQVQLAAIVGEIEASRAVQMLVYWSL